VSRSRGRGRTQASRSPDDSAGRTYSSAATEDDAASTEGLWFRLDGVKFTCHGRLSAFDLAEFAGRAEDAGEDSDIRDPGVIRILADFMHTVLGERTYVEVTAHRRKHRTPDEVMQKILFDLIEDTVNRPTASPSPSPAGRPVPVSPPAVLPSPAGPPLAESAARLRSVAALQALAAEGDVTFADTPGEHDPTAEERPPVIRRVSFAHPEKPVTVEPMPTAGTG
jgi:hypothetical protein